MVINNHEKDQLVAPDSMLWAALHGEPHRISKAYPKRADAHASATNRSRPSGRRFSKTDWASSADTPPPSPLHLGQPQWRDSPEQD